jgi:hypothetical protein
MPCGSRISNRARCNGQLAGTRSCRLLLLGHKRLVFRRFDPERKWTQRFKEPQQLPIASEQLAPVGEIGGRPARRCRTHHPLVQDAVKPLPRAAQRKRRATRAVECAEVDGHAQEKCRRVRNLDVRWRPVGWPPPILSPEGSNLTTRELGADREVRAGASSKLVGARQPLTRGREPRHHDALREKYGSDRTRCVSMPPDEANREEGERNRPEGEECACIP